MGGGGGTAPSPYPSPTEEGDTPSRDTTPLDVFGVSILVPPLLCSVPPCAAEAGDAPVSSDAIMLIDIVFSVSRLVVNVNYTAVDLICYKFTILIIIAIWLLPAVRTVGWTSLAIS